MIHYLILAHKDFNQVQLLINKLNTNNSQIYVHIDGKVKDFPKLKNAKLIKNRVKTNWGGFSQIKTEVNGIKEVYNNMKEGDHIVIISGQCRPIKNMNYVEKYINKLGEESCIDYIKANEDIEKRVDSYYFNDLHLHLPYLDKRLYYIFEKMGYKMMGAKNGAISILLSSIINHILPKRKYLLSNYNLYKGSNWIIISHKHIKRAINFLKTDKGKKFYSAFKHSNCADELFFQTMLYNSPIKNEIRNKTLRYTKRERGWASPHIITSDFYDELKKSDKLFARKFDINIDWRIIEKLEKSI